VGRPDSELYRAARLDTALEWNTASGPDLTELETAFLDASRAHAASEHDALVVRAARDARQNRRLRQAFVGIALVAVVALVAGLIAYRQRHQADDNARDAVAERERADDERQRAETAARSSALQALVSKAAALHATRRDVAALLAVEAYRLNPNADTEAALFGTFTASPGVQRVVHTGLPLSIGLGSASFLDDGRTVAVPDELGGIHLVDMATQEVEGLPALSERPGWPQLDAAAEGRFLAVTWRPAFEPDTGLLTVWDLDTRTQRFDPVLIPFRIGAVAIAPDGSTVVASGGGDGRTLIFDGVTGDLRLELEPIPRPDDTWNQVATVAVAFSPNGSLALGSQAGPIRLVDPASGREIQRFAGKRETSESAILFSGDGRTIVAAGNLGIQAFDVESAAPVWDEPASNGGDNACNSYALAERVGAVLCGDWSGRVRALDLATGVEVRQRFDAQFGLICALAVSPDGDRLVEVSSCQGDGVTLVEWSLDGGGPVSRLVVETTDDRSVGPYRSAGLVAEYYPDRTDLIDPGDGQLIASFPDIYGLLPTDQPSIAVAIYDDGSAPPRVGLYDTERRAPAGPRVDPGIPIDGIQSDGHYALITSAGQLRRVDLVAGTVTSVPVDLGENQFFTALVLGDDGDFYTGLYDHSGDRPELAIQRRDLASGAILATSGRGFDNVATGGGVIIATGADGRIAELDDVTLEELGAPFSSASGPIATLGIDQSGRRLMVRADDETLRFYDIPTRTPLGDPIETKFTLGTAVLRADGKAAAAVTGQGIVTWDLDPEHWQAAACELAGRNLTREEWDRYIGDLASYAPTCPDQPVP
jgi:WD40 repeat protein